jgi:hypothetical protein
MNSTTATSVHPTITNRANRHKTEHIQVIPFGLLLTIDTSTSMQSTELTAVHLTTILAIITVPHANRANPLESELVQKTALELPWLLLICPLQANPLEADGTLTHLQAEDMIILGMVQEYRVINTMGVMTL